MAIEIKMTEICEDCDLAELYLDDAGRVLKQHDNDVEMTREEAIERIKDHIQAHRMSEPRAVKISEALYMAIEALKKLNVIERIISEPRIYEDILKYKMIVKEVER